MKLRRISMLALTGLGLTALAACDKTELHVKVDNGAGGDTTTTTSTTTTDTQTDEKATRESAASDDAV